MTVDVGNLPKEINLIKSADLGKKFVGALPLADFPRLVGLICHPEGFVEVDLVSGVDKDGLRYLRGRICLTVELICQRCNEPVAYPLTLNISLSPIVHEQQATELPEQYDPVVTKGESVLLRDLIEEEILLGLPMIPKHEIGQCLVELPQDLH